MYSNNLTIVLAFAPDKMNSPNTSIKNGSLEVTWIAPSDNGAPITSYNLFIKG